MAERPELLGLATEIVSAHVSHNAIAADQLRAYPAGVQRACYRRAGDCCAPAGGTGSAGEEVRVGKSHRLSRLRQAFLHAEAAPDDRPQDDAGAVPPALGVATSYPLVAPDYAKTRSSLAKKFGLGRKGQAAPKRAPRMSRKRGLGEGTGHGGCDPLTFCLRISLAFRC